MRWSFPLLALLAATATAGEKSTLCDDKGRNCVELEIANPDGVQVLYVGDSDREPRFLPLHSFSARRGFLGVGLTEITPELRRFYGVPEDAGVLISSVEAGSPAEGAGIQVGDVLTLADGKSVDSASALIRVIRDKKDGEVVPLEVWRKGRARTLRATVTEKERAQYDLSQLLHGHKLQMDGHVREALEQLKDARGNFVLRFDPDTAREYTERWQAYMQACGEEGGDCPWGRPGLSAREQELERRIADLEEKLSQLARKLESRPAR